MLDGMRRGALNWFGKGLLALLIVAFAIWGISDVVRNSGRGTLATVGGTTISAEDYRQAYNDEINSLSRQFGRRLTPDLAKRIGVPQRALSRLVGAAAIEIHARKLGLGISDQGLAAIIQEEPAFKGPDGKFNMVAFQSYLRQIGMSEPRFVAERRREELRDQITDTLLGGLTPSQAMIDAMHRYWEEKRSVETITPDYDKLLKLPEPDEAKLKAFYEQAKAQYMTPEYRKVNALLLARAPLMDKVSVTEEDIKAAFEKDKDKYNIPEKRRIQQIAFKDLAEAQKAYAELVKAKDFKEAATKLGYKESDFELGTFAKRDMIDSKIADAAFGLRKDELSKPVEGQFSIVLVRVTEITPGQQKTLQDVRKDIVEAIKTQRTNDQIRTLHEKVDEARGASRTLKEIATEFGLVYSEGVEFDRTGNQPDNKPAFPGNEGQRIAQGAFAATQGVEAEHIELADGGYAWIDLVAVTAPKQKSFDEVKDDVVKQVKDQDRRREITQFASKLVERLNAGEAIEKIATEIGAKVEKSQPFTRRTSPHGLPQTVVQQAFATPKGSASAAVAEDRATRIVLRVTEITPAAEITEAEKTKLKGELTQQMQSDVLAQYLTSLQASLGLKVNEEAMRQALGEGSEPTALE